MTLENVSFDQLAIKTFELCEILRKNSEETDSNKNLFDEFDSLEKEFEKNSEELRHLS